MESNANIEADTAMHTNLSINYETPFLSQGAYLLGTLLLFSIWVFAWCIVQ